MFICETKRRVAEHWQGIHVDVSNPKPGAGSPHSLTLLSHVSIFLLGPPVFPPPHP